MKFSIAALFIVITIQLNGQLIRNGGFETWCGNSCIPQFVYDSSPFHDYCIDEIQDWHSTYFDDPDIGTYLLSSDQCHPNGTLFPSQCNIRSGDACAGLAFTGGGQGFFYRREFIIGETEYLTGGQEYFFEMWVSVDNVDDITIGAYFDQTKRSQLWNPQTGVTMGNYLPQIEMSFDASELQVNQYFRVFGCFTPPTSGEYFVHIGSFSNLATGSVYGNIDDVSLVPSSGGASPLISNFNLDQTEYCFTDDIIFTNINSQGFDEYRWQIFDENGVNLIYSTGFIDNVAPTTLPNSFNVRNELISNGVILDEDECYQMVLTVSNGNCTASSSFDFCIQSPGQAQISGPTTPLCEDEEIIISLNAPNANSYTWSDGSTTFTNGNSSESFIAIYNNGQPNNFSVSYTTSAGCTSQPYSFNVIVHTQNNIPPILTTPSVTNYTMESGTYLTLNFESSDSPEERVDVLVTNVSFNGNPWVISTSSQPYAVNNGPLSGLEYELLAGIYGVGYYEFDVTLTDNNACNSLAPSFHFNVEAICPNCQLCNYYSNNSPTTNALPPLTEAAECIEAGNGPVTMDNSQVIFRAGQIIKLEPGFESGPNFIAEIDPSVCSPEDCFDCCSDGLGFTTDNLVVPNVITPDNDFENDFWFIYDIENPSCMFNAQRWYLDIFNLQGTPVWSIESPENIEANYCCRFDAVYMYSNVLNNEYIPQAWFGIFNVPYWTGHTNVGAQQGSLVSDGTYFGIFRLEGCGQIETHQFFIQKLMNQNLQMADEPISSSLENSDQNTNDVISSQGSSDLNVFPSPTKGQVNYSMQNLALLKQVVLYSSKGEIVKKYNNVQSGMISIENFENGLYYLKFIMLDGAVEIRKIVKA